jgi:RecA/RadA recombinase
LLNPFLFTENLLKNPSEILKLPTSKLKYWGYNSAIRRAQFKSHVGKALFPPFQTMNKIFQDNDMFQLLRFNVPKIDQLLRGGIDLCSLTEINGAGGSGKTQLCLQLAFTCRLPVELGGADGNVMYLCTDKFMSGRRLEQLDHAFKSKYGDFNFLDRIFVTELNNSNDFQEFVKVCLPEYFKTIKTMKLLVIDSIAGIFRIETNYIERAKLFCQLFEELNKLALEHKFAIVCTNHVTAIPDVGESAALGNTWSSLVATRINILKMGSSCSININGKNEVSRIRKMTVDFSPRLPSKTEEFIITSCGIDEVPPINLTLL